METTTGAKAIVWGTVATEMTGVLYDLRYMVICSVGLILADLWWGYRESKKRLEYAKTIGNETLMDKFKWHKSRAIRRTANKTVDYITYLVVGALMGLGITEQMDICSHIWTAAIGLGLGCTCEVASIVGHVVYVKMDMEISAAEVWRAFTRFLGRLIKAKSEAIGEAVEGLAEKEENHE